MNKLIYSNVIAFWLFLITLSGQAQVKDKSYYLVDGVDESALIDYDKRLLDSLLKVYHSEKSDTLRLNAIKGLSEFLNDATLWPKYNRYLYSITKNRTDSLGLIYFANALNNLGYEYQYIKNDIPSALDYYQKSFEVFEKVQFEKGMAVELNNLAYIYQHQGNVEESIELFSKVEAIFSRLHDSDGQASSMINLGDIYFNNNEFETAENYFNKALVYAKGTGREQIVANVYNQLGAVYGKRQELTKANDFYTKALEIYTKYENYSRMAIIELSIANNLNFEGKFELAELRFLNCIQNARLSGDLQVKSKVYDYAAYFYLSRKNFVKALQFADSAYYFAKEIGYPDLILKSAKKLGELHHLKKNDEKAYLFLLESYIMNDSLYNDKIKNNLIKQKYKLDYSKKELQLQAEQEKKDAVRLAEKKKEQTILNLTIAALIIISLFAFLAYRNFIKAKRAKQIIQTQKALVETQKEEISLQKLAVEEKQKEIIDSIYYAKRIQQAVLTGSEIWNKISNDYFILFEPKDIVSGDFYWAHLTINNRAIFALADCTGHGVPGAFMSMLGNSFLNEIVVDNKLFKADEILNKLRSKIIAALSQEGGIDQKDGMDLSLCVWNKLDNTLEFSGANNPLWLLRNGEIMEYKGDKMPIGTYTDVVRDFTSTTIQLQKGDIIYLITDGFADQFGGPRGKKFKYRPLMDLLVKNHALPVAIQKMELHRALLAWKKDYEQVDDISVIGIVVT